MIELLGMVGGTLFAVAAIPAAVRTIQAGRSIGTPVDTAWLIFLGVTLIGAYIWLKHGPDPILLATQAAEGISWAVILVYHYKKGGV